MLYYIIAENGFVSQLCEVNRSGNNGVSASEYNTVLEMLKDKPIPPDGYEYRLRADTLEWELVDLPPAPDPAEQEITAEEALAEIEEVLGYEA